MKKKLKLPFVQLEKELYEVISAEELRSIVGGIDPSMMTWNTDYDIADNLNALIAGGYDFGGGSGSGTGALGGSNGSGSGGLHLGVGGGSGTSPRPIVLSGSGANVSIVRSGGSWQATVILGGISVTFSGPLGVSPNGSHSAGGSYVPGTGNPNNMGIKINF